MPTYFITVKYLNSDICGELGTYSSLSCDWLQYLTTEQNTDCPILAIQPTCCPVLLTSYSNSNSYSNSYSSSYS